MVRPEQWNDICPLCPNVVFDTPTYQQVFDHNKDQHDMNEEDNDLVSQAISMQNKEGVDISDE